MKATLALTFFDLRRMTVSILLAAIENGFSGFDAQEVVRNFLDSYINKMSDFNRTHDQVYDFRLDSTNTNGVVNDIIQSVAGKDRASLLSKKTMINSDGNRVFQITSELQPLSSDTYAAINDTFSLTFYNADYHLKDICLKLGSGTGSLGRYRYYLLLDGPSNSTDDDLILEMKQETSSAVAIAVPGLLPSPLYGDHEGARVLLAARTMGNTDPSLNYITVNNLFFMLREKSPFQKDFDYAKLTTKTKFMDAMGYAGKVVAKTHAIGGYSVAQAVTDIVSGNEAAFKNEIVNFAVDYATQVEYDYQSFRVALDQGVPLY